MSLSMHVKKDLNQKFDGKYLFHLLDFGFGAKEAMNMLKLSATIVVLSGNEFYEPGMQKRDNKLIETNRVKIDSKWVDAERSLSTIMYMARKGDNAIWGTRTLIKLPESEKPILEIIKKHELDLFTLKGVATIDYKGVVNKKCAFRVNGDCWNPIEIDSALVKELRDQ